MSARMTTEACKQQEHIECPGQCDCYCHYADDNYDTPGDPDGAVFGDFDLRGDA